MKYQCIIFDCDGVLVDSEEISNSVLLQMASRAGIEINKQYAIQHFNGKSLQSTFREIEKLLGKPLPATFEQDYRAASYKAFALDLKAIKGVHHFIEKLHIPFCVASSGPPQKIKQNLATTNLLDKFTDRIFSCYDIGSWKPEPQIFLHAAKTMGFLPEQCAVIEDSLSGIKAARSGGFDVYALTSKKNKLAFESVGAAVFHSMDDLYDLIQ